MTTDPYSDEVRRRFTEPGYAGSGGETVARCSGQDVDIELSTDVADGRLQSLRFRAYGCPHTIAACELACERLNGEPLAALGDLSIGELMRTLSVPVAKTGRILVLEDALRDLKSRLTRL